MCARLGLDELERRTNGISGGVGSAAEQSVSLAHLDEHGAEVVALGQCSAAVLLAHLALAELYHLGYHGIHLRIGCRIDDLHALDIKAALCSSSLNSLYVADQDGVHQAVLLQAGSSLKNTGILALGKYDGTLFSLQSRNQVLKHISFSFVISSVQAYLARRQTFSIYIIHPCRRAHKTKFSFTCRKS